MNGWIKLHRKIVNWEWYHDQKVRIVFLHVLLKANYKDKMWNGILVARGQLVTSRAHLAQETSLSISQVRRSLNNLKMTGELTIKTTSKYTLITVENYAFYQGDDEENDQVFDQQNAQEIASKTATTKEIKNYKKYIEYKDSERRFSTDDQLNDAILEFAKMRKSMKKPMTERAIDLMLKKLNQLTIDPVEQTEIINQSIINGWTGLYPIKINIDNRPRSNSKSSFQNTTVPGNNEDLEKIIREKGRSK